MPTQSEENKQVIQQRYNALVRGDTDTLFASTHKGDPQERDRRVLRNMTFIASMGLAMDQLHRLMIGWDPFETEYQLEARIEELHAELEGTTPVTSERRFLEVIPAAARGQIV
jgi:hypothetical protein